MLDEICPPAWTTSSQRCNLQIWVMPSSRSHILWYPMNRIAMAVGSGQKPGPGGQVEATDVDKARPDRELQTGRSKQKQTRYVGEVLEAIKMLQQEQRCSTIKNDAPGDLTGNNLC